jgi:eukaryotic-like serine/threonine-protein kinase
LGGSTLEVLETRDKLNTSVQVPLYPRSEECSLERYGKPELVGESRLGTTMTNSAVQTQSRLRYRPIIALGHGGMADVLLSVGRGPSGFNKLVVLKTMRKELVTDEDLRQMFLAEARLSARLNHANVVQVYEVVDTALPCIIMEYLEGQPMSGIQHEAGERFTLPLQLKVISETLAGLHYSHELKDYDGTPLNIVHRDVSPQNVFVTYDGVVKVLDFGIAKASDATNQTRTGVIKGKITYMPREQLLSEHIDRRADVYAVGCMLWHAAAGVKLWDGMQEGEVMRALIEGVIPKPSEKRPVDSKLEAIVMKALAPEPEGRYATAQDLRSAVDDYLAETSPRTNMREVGDLVSELFAEQQEARKRHIHLVLTTPRSEPPPPIPEGIESIVQSPTGSSVHSMVLERNKQMVWTVGIAVGAAVLALGGMIAFLTWRDSGGEPAPTSSIAVAPAQIQIRLTATPAAATLTVDGNPLSGNPALLTVSADDRSHEIRAALSGYEPYVKSVRFERDLSLEIMLQQSAVGAAAAASTTAPKTSKTPPPSGKATKVPPVTNVGKKTSPNCDPPFYFENGIKVYKPGCL